MLLSWARAKGERSNTACRIEKHVYTAPGEQIYYETIPAAAMQDGRLRIEFAVEEAFSFGADDRELGVLVNFMGRSPISLL